ncbi:MAG: thiamine-phosphate kinase [Methyloligellaceae bacterium]
MGNGDNSEKSGEFELIAQIFSPLSKNYSGAFNLLDDCASYTSEPGFDLVVTKDTIVSGVHFLDDNPAASIAIKALSVNLSDIAAKGAVPKVYLLSIALPATKSNIWLQEFAKGLSGLQSEYNIHLIGGDTVSTPGPLTITITIIGQVPVGQMALRSGAKSGDQVYVTGTIGDSWLGLQTFINREAFQLFSAGETDWIKDRYLHPQPRNKLASVIRDYASASMDISDGLLTDLQKLCKASKLGGSIYTNLVPLSPVAKKYIQHDSAGIEKLITGGDDYELLVTVPSKVRLEFEEAASEQGVAVTKIGETSDTASLDVLDKHGEKLIITSGGYDHFC